MLHILFLKICIMNRDHNLNKKTLDYSSIIIDKIFVFGMILNI